MVPGVAGEPKVLERDALDTLFDALAARGHTVIGPTVRAQAIVLDEIASSADLPIGWTDEQDGGRYRLVRRDDEACFGFALGPTSWKRFQLPPRLRIHTTRRAGGEWTVEPEPEAPPRYAFLGARACDLAAVGILDTVLVRGARPDPRDVARRAETLIVAVQCGQAGGTCFCASMGTGPELSAESHEYDLALTELLDGGRHAFLVTAASAAGAELLAALPVREAQAADVGAAAQAPLRAAREQGREMDTDGIRELLYRNLEHPRWDEVAERCLTCGNCTMVCPTCFCTSVTDTTDVTGDTAERWQEWASCFTVDYSHLHGGSVRGSGRSRYRQWATHKLATWFDQFGSSGCVGCGRCITWCPVGIDLTEELAAIRASDGATRGGEDRGAGA